MTSTVPPKQDDSQHLQDVKIDSDEKIDIGGDVVGRDKIYNSFGGVSKEGLVKLLIAMMIIVSFFIAVAIVVIVVVATDVANQLAIEDKNRPPAREIVFVPPGEFLIGSADSDPFAKDEEKPQHTVYIDAFWIDWTEVTNGMYAHCVSVGVCNLPDDHGLGHFGNSQHDNYPVIGVAWNDAREYCEWVEGRLPTEAEWEKAARGTDGRIYPWGNEGVAGTLLNFCDDNCDHDWARDAINDNSPGIAPVGSYPNGASPYGVLDMAGNVWEWVADWYDGTYHSLIPTDNPPGPSSGQKRVTRGGAYESGENHVRTASRSQNVPTDSYKNISFRCARSL